MAFSRHETHDVAPDNILTAYAAQQFHHLIDQETLDTAFEIGNTWANRRVHTVQVEGDLNRRITDALVDELLGLFHTKLTITFDRHHLVA